RGGLLARCDVFDQLGATADRCFLDGGRSGHVATSWGEAALWGFGRRLQRVSGIRLRRLQPRAGIVVHAWPFLDGRNRMRRARQGSRKKRGLPKEASKSDAVARSSVANALVARTERTRRLRDDRLCDRRLALERDVVQAEVRGRRRRRRVQTDLDRVRGAIGE